MHYRHSSVAYYGFINALYHHSLYPLVSCSGLCSGLPAVPRIIRLNVVIIVWNEKRSPATQFTVTWRSYSRIKVDKRTRTMAQWHGIVSTWKGKKGKRQQQQHNTLYCNPPFPFLCCFLILRTCSNNNTILIFLFSSSYGRLDVNGANHFGSSFLVIWTPKIVLAATNDQLRSARVPTLNSSPLHDRDQMQNPTSEHNLPAITVHRNSKRMQPMQCMLQSRQLELSAIQWNQAMRGLDYFAASSDTNFEFHSAIPAIIFSKVLIMIIAISLKTIQINVAVNCPFFSFLLWKAFFKKRFWGRKMKNFDL